MDVDNAHIQRLMRRAWGYTQRDGFCYNLIESFSKLTGSPTTKCGFFTRKISVEIIIVMHSFTSNFCLFKLDSQNWMISYLLNN